jgi:alpha-D-xyloside xylohydrolase
MANPTIACNGVLMKKKLMPHIYAKAIEASQRGTPMLRAMFLEFPKDLTCWYLDQQYRRKNSVPNEKWIGLFDGNTRQGPRWLSEKHSFFNLPLLLREKSVIPIGREERPDYVWPLDIKYVTAGAMSGDSSATRSADVPSAEKPRSAAEKILVPTDENGVMEAVLLKG